MPPFAPPEPLDRILPSLIDDLYVRLGDDLVGAYLFGSAISGGFDPTISDLDLLVVTARSTDEIDFEVFSGVVRRLQAREQDWAHRLDIVFAGRPTLATFRDGGPFVEISHDDPLQRRPDASEWLETWFHAREADVALFGPSARSFIPEIGIDAFLAAAEDNVPARIREFATDERSGAVAYLILTLCRTLRSLETRATCSKAEGAVWVMDRHPDWSSLVQAALEVRATDGARDLTPEDRASIPAFAAFMAEQIRRR